MITLILVSVSLLADDLRSICIRLARSDSMRFIIIPIGAAAFYV